MENMDKIKTVQQIRDEWKQKLDAAKQEDHESINQKYSEELVSALVLEKTSALLEQYKLAADDEAIAQAIGVRKLTQAEKAYFKEFANTLANPKQALTTAQKDAMPVTTINRLFEDLKQDHELLALVDTTPAGVKKWLVGDFTGAGGWGPLNATIVDEISATITAIDLEVMRASAFMAVIKGIVDLGEQFIELYIRQIMAEVLETVLEKGIVTGNGKDMPVGMNRDLSQAFHPTTGYPEKTAVAIADFGPAEYGAKIALLTKNGKRKVSEVVLIVNPMDYLTKVMPAITLRTPTGEYASTLPFPTKLVQSAEVATGKAILGIGKNYLFGVSRLELAVYAEIRALSDEYLYIAKAYANGRPKDNDSFVVLNIASVVAPAFGVEVKNTTAKPVNTKEVA